MADDPSLVCPNGHLNSPTANGVRFCRTCGAAMRTRCSNGHDVPASVKFCSICGVPIRSESPQPPPVVVAPGDDPEIRTVVFGGQPEASARTGPLDTGLVTPATGVPAGQDLSSMAAAPGGLGSVGPGEPGPPVLYARPKRRTGRIVTAICVGAAVLIAAGIGAYALVGRSPTSNHTDAASSSSSSHHKTALATTTTMASNTTTTTVISSTQQQANGLNALLDQSSADRSQVQGATQQIAACTDLSQAQQVLRSAASSRQTLINELGQLQVSELPNAERLISTLNLAWQNSAASDNAYANWGADEDAKFTGCTMNDTSDGSYVAAQSTDQMASSAKQSFISLWNPIALQYALPQLTALQI